MSKLIPIISGLVGTTIIAGGGGYLLATQSAKTIKEAFKEAILNFESDDKLIKEKLKKLGAAQELPKDSIFKVAQVEEKKTADSGLDEFKKACTKIYNSNFTEKESETFKNFKDYCARTIKDKITSAKWGAEDADWENGLNKLKTNNPKPVSEKLINLKSKEAIKEWCTKSESLVFEGESNLEFKDANSYCLKKS